MVYLTTEIYLGENHRSPYASHSTTKLFRQKIT